MKRVYLKEEACIGCELCRIYCQAEHSRSKDIIKAFKKEKPRPSPRIRVENIGEVSLSIQCRHCDEPWCVYSCLTGAMSKDPVSGVVSVDTTKCIGCWTCILACPVGAIAQDTCEEKIVKCDLCTGKDMPACAANCPNEALVYAGAQSDTVNNTTISHSTWK